DPEEADQHPDDREARRPLAARQPHQHDEKRHRGDDERCDAGRDRALGDEEEAVRAGEQEPDERGARELAARHPERPATATPCDPARHQGAGEHDARGDGAERRDRVPRDADPEVRRPPDHVDGREGRPRLRSHRLSVSTAPTASSAIPSTRGQLSAICSKPKRPKRSIAVPIASCPATSNAIVAAVPMRGDTTVMLKTMKVPSAPPAHIHFGAAHASERPPVPRRATRSTAIAITTESSVAQASASTVPIRSPKRPITAAWTDPARPAASASTAAVPVPPLTTPTLYTRADGSLSQRT